MELLPPGLDLADKFWMTANKVWMLKFQFFFLTAETFKVVHAQLPTEVGKAGNGDQTWVETHNLLQGNLDMANDSGDSSAFFLLYLYWYHY